MAAVLTIFVTVWRRRRSL